MQVGVIGGISLLACLLSVAQAEELSDTKAVQESEGPDQNMNNSSKEASDDLKDDNTETTTLSVPLHLEDGLISFLEAQNVSQSNGESSSTAYNSIGPTSSLAHPGIISKSVSNVENHDQIVNPSSQFSVNQGASQPQAQLNGGYFNSDPYFQNNYQQRPSDRPLNPQRLDGNKAPMYQPGLSNSAKSTFSLDIGEKEQLEKESQNSMLKTYDKNTFNEILSKQPPSYQPTFTNNVIGPIPPIKLPEMIAPPPTLSYSPLLQQKKSKTELVYPSPQVDYLGGSSNLDKHNPTLTYSQNTKNVFDTRRESVRSDNVQVDNAKTYPVSSNRTVYQFSNAENSYPYTPLESKASSNEGESENTRSGAPYEQDYPSYLGSGISSSQAYAKAQSSSNTLTTYNQGLNPYSYGYPPAMIANAGNVASASAVAQTSHGVANAHISANVLNAANSRVILVDEYIFPHKIPGGENVLQCTRENELHHFWAPGFDCLVCICLNEYGLLEPVCASCSGCRHPATSKPPPYYPQPYAPPMPDTYVPLPIPDLEPLTPPVAVPSLILEPIQDVETTPIPPREAVTCSPLPLGQPFQHPLQPCQMCICLETYNVMGQINVKIECQDSYNCVVPLEVTPMPRLPDVPLPVPREICETFTGHIVVNKTIPSTVALRNLSDINDINVPNCEKFPAQVFFPHPSEKCKKCRCSVELSVAGVPEHQITCFPDGNCATEVVTEPMPVELVTPPAPPIPVPVEPYPAPFPEPEVDLIPEHFPKAPDGNPREPLPWPPFSTTPHPPIPVGPKQGPLPGPSPHESCRPYPPNQPFQHPWDECQVCECSESKAIGMVTVEISCYTKLSCCIATGTPEQLILGNSGINGGGNQANVISNYKPPFIQNRGIAESSAEAIAQNSESYPSYLGPGSSYQSANANSNVVGNGHAQATAEASGFKSFSPNGQDSSTSQAYAAANTLALNSLNNPNVAPGYYQFANVHGSAVNGGQSSAEAFTDNNLASSGNPSLPFGPYNPLISQNNVFAEASAVAQNQLINPSYSLPVQYKPNGGLSSEVTEEYAAVPRIYQNTLAYPQFTGYSQSQSNPDMNGQNNYKPPGLYSLYNSDAQPGRHQAYPEAAAQYNDLMANTQKPAAIYDLYSPSVSQAQTLTQANSQYSPSVSQLQAIAQANGQYSPSISQIQGLAQANTQYNGLSSTFKPPSLYSKYNQDIHQNQGYAQANAQYSGGTTSRPRPWDEQYQTGLNQAQVYPSQSPLYKGPKAATENPLAAYNPYNAGTSQAQAYAEIQNSPGYYPGPYQSKKARGILSGGEQSSIAEALAQSQDYSPYMQVAQQINPASGYANPSSYYSGYLAPQYQAYDVRSDPGLEGYKPSPKNYAGNYEFNGQADTVSVLTPQSGYYPYGSGYSQGISNVYSSMYPKRYDISPFRPPQNGGINAQSAAQAYSTTKMQTKSGEGLQEDSADSN